MFGLDPTLTTLFIICILLACFFEFINGFHDTANAVATVIYTNSLKPTVAVIYSGILNFAGVMLGGIAVAMGIVNLLPMDVLVDENPYHGIAMILALLLSAIIWNFSTWYYGIPSSSSHTIIGSILGIGVAFYFLPGDAGTSMINWDKAKDTGLALLLSPLLGFSAAIIVMFIFKRIFKNEVIYKEPVPGKTPPLWIRSLLWLTCGLVSFFHGQNDGQKGVGLMMMILIAVLPGYFAVDNSIGLKETLVHVQKIEHLMSRADTLELSAKERRMYQDVMSFSGKFMAVTANKSTAIDIPVKERFGLRKDLIKVTKNTDKIIKGGNLTLSTNEIKELNTHLKATKRLYEYAPTWVILIISICLGLGTMVGWKRIVKTVGEKIGKQHMSYAQGASAELVASLGIGLASWKGVPVSTTHMLSSGVAGTMVAKKGIKNLQKGTIKTIALTWALTLPVTIILSASLFLLFRLIF
jgi:inorganic phosphate transporter, PiT family